jgi:hypothetical protein
LPWAHTGHPGKWWLHARGEASVRGVWNEAYVPDQAHMICGGIIMNDDDHRKKMIAPVVIAMVFLVYLVAYAVVIMAAATWNPLLMLFIIPLVGIGIGMVYVLVERIKEIRSGEEDDLGDY